MRDGMTMGMTVRDGSAASLKRPTWGLGRSEFRGGLALAIVFAIA